MIILIKKVKNTIYIDKEKGIYFETLKMNEEPYNYKKLVIDDKYSDCINQDFNDDLTFNPIRYEVRKNKEKNIKLINDYKRKLKETDYKAIKYAEGVMSLEEYAPVKIEREMYRSKINELEKSIM